MRRGRHLPASSDWVRIQLFTAIHFICLVAFAIFIKASVASLVVVRSAFYLDPVPTVWSSLGLFFGEMNRVLVPLVREAQHAMGHYSGHTVVMVAGLWALLTIFNARMARVVQTRKAQTFIGQMSIADRERFGAVRGLDNDRPAAQ